MKKSRPDLQMEKAAWKAGYLRVAGVDEAGRGPWAGPLAAAAVILPPDPGLGDHLCGVTDSKQMSSRQRVFWRDRICESAAAWGVGFAEVEEIDSLGLPAALQLAVSRALDGLSCRADYLYLDYMKLRGMEIPHSAFKRGDTRCLSIAAASVLAKTARDSVMIELDRVYPGYGFAAHKGYGTAAHRQAIEELGVSPIHRRSFAPVRLLLDRN